MGRVRKFQQKHQLEGYDFVHYAQRLTECDFRGYIRHTVPLEDNELREHGGCDGREYLLDDSFGGACGSEIECRNLDLQRTKGFESR